MNHNLLDDVSLFVDGDFDYNIALLSSMAEAGNGDFTHIESLETLDSVLLEEFTTAAEKTLRHFSQRLQTMPEAVPYMLQALDFSLEEPVRAVVAGDASKEDARTLLQAIHSVYQPNKVVLGNQGPVEPFARTLPAKDGAVIYFCTGTSCRPPMKVVKEIREAVKGKAG